VSRGRVLLVEDEFLVRLILGEALTEAGYEVVEADGGEAGVRLIEEGGPFDVVITDVQMPGPTDGIAVARQARKRLPEVPIIFATARPDSLRRFEGRGQSEVVIQKPYGPEQVLAALGRLQVGASE
jgi:two-component system cell cycle sensor histidine kinase/response regulator CckA